MYPIPTTPKLSILTFLKEYFQITLIGLELFSFLTILFMGICIYSSFIQLKLFHIFQLIPNHHTDQSSLLFCGAYLW